jgi:N-6 DNA methylase
MPTEPLVDDPNELVWHLEQVVRWLGFAENPGLVRRWADYAAVTSRHVVRQAFDTMGVHAVFGFSSNPSGSPKKYAPVLYFAACGDDTKADRLHRLVWSQGVVPILLIATPAALQIRKSLAPPPPRPLSVPWDKLADGQPLPIELTSLTAVSLTSSVVWNDYAIDRSNRVDRALLDAIIALNDEVRGQFPDWKPRPGTVNSVIGRFLYFFVLLDRGIVTASWVKGLKDSDGKSLCDKIGQSLLNGGSIDIGDRPWPAREVWALFDRIDDILNGTVFPISAAERRYIPTQALHLVRRAIRHGDLLRQGTRQLGFLDVSFATLRTETISAIYELFLLIEAPDDKSDEGAFYTPPFLVDYVLDEVDRIRPFTASSRTLDPAAGSGIFLVGAYRRILERTMPRGRWKAEQFKKARTLLEKSIFGIERNPQAANVARFSLYLTLLDYVENTAIDALRKLVPQEHVFPPLSGNVFDQDVFTINRDEEKEVGRFTHVVGNPPWGSMAERADRTNVQRAGARSERRRASLEAAIAFHRELDPSEFPVTNKRLSELFVWKIHRDLIARTGVLGILISTRSFVAPTATAFPNALAKHMRIAGIANLSHFRYRLFKGARSPTLAIFAEAAQPEALDPVWIYSPLLTSQPIGERGHLWSIIVSELDVEHYRLRDLTRPANGWFWALMLRPIDRHFANYLKLWASRFNSTFGDFLGRSGLVISRGGSPSQTGLPRELLLGATDYRERLGLDGLGFSRYPHEQVAKSAPKVPFAKMFSGNIVLIPRHMNEITFVERPIAFGSSFNALYFSENLGVKRKSVTALRSVTRILDSDVARYLYAMFGKTRLLDRARVEKNDLAEIPFPFAEVGDADLEGLATLSEDDLTRLFAAKVGLDDAFVGTVQEYATFRHEYEDSQIPNAGLSPPYPESVIHYRSMLISQLSQQFGPEARIDHDLTEPTDNERFAYIDIHIARTTTDIPAVHDATHKSAAANATFSPHANIVFHPRLSQASVSKPWTRVAWTIEQAYADARAISEEVLRSGAPA